MESRLGIVHYSNGLESYSGIVHFRKGLESEFSHWPLPWEGTRIKGLGASNIPVFYPYFKQKLTRIVHAFWANWTRIKNSQHWD